MLLEALDITLATKCVVSSDSIRKEFNSGALTLSCLAAFDYQMKHQGIELTIHQKKKLFSFLELGKIINNYYDERSPLPVEQYKYLRKQLFSTPLSRNNFSFYYRNVALLENNRPNPWKVNSSCADQVEEYRSKTNLVYWGAACTAADITKDIKDLVNDDIDFNPDSPRWFQGMHSYLVAFQVIDDKIGWKGDLRFKRPSFFTALCPKTYLDCPPEIFPKKIVETVYQEMDERLFVYMDKAKQQLPDNYAMELAMTTLKFVPALANIKWYKGLQGLTGIELVNPSHFNE